MSVASECQVSKVGCTGCTLHVVVWWCSGCSGAPVGLEEKVALMLRAPCSVFRGIGELAGLGITLRSDHIRVCEFANLLLICLIC